MDTNNQLANSQFVIPAVTQSLRQPTLLDQNVNQYAAISGHHTDVLLAFARTALLLEPGRKVTNTIGR